MIILFDQASVTYEIFQFLYLILIGDSRKKPAICVDIFISCYLPMWKTCNNTK